MKHLFLIVFICLSASLFGQQTDYTNEILTYWQEWNETFASGESPLEPQDKKTFSSLLIFPVDSTYRFSIKIDVDTTQGWFEMPTSTERKPIYRKYGTVSFQLNGANQKLTLYQNQRLLKEPGYHNYLFIPFKDYTNGIETYGGGRYVEVYFDANLKIELDFNKAYNPFCAYNHNYSCPLVPEENHLTTRIEAGVFYLFESSSESGSGD